MWKAIKAALKAIAEVMNRTTSVLAYGGDWVLDLWNKWARLISGTSYRPERVTDATDHVEEMTALPEPDVSPRDDQTELGRRVRRTPPVRPAC